ncbi:MAG: RidA family protein [Rhodovibrionaceae bacterium]
MARHRRSLEVSGVKHAAPIPMGARVGNMVFSSGIMGQDPATGKLPEDPEQQAYFAFQNMQAMMQEAGGDIGDIGHITVFIKDNSLREHVNKQWLAFYPDESDRPARHAILLDLPSGMLVQLEVIAVLKD